MNDYRHLYLYAKGWYAQRNELSDLKYIIGRIMALKPDDVSVRDVELILLGLAHTEIEQSGNPDHDFKVFVLDAVSDAIGPAALAVLKLSKHDRNDLGNPDPDVLPLAEV